MPWAAEIESPSCGNTSLSLRAINAVLRMGDSFSASGHHSQLLFRFKDGSLHDEKVAFSQQRVFTLISYRLVQRCRRFRTSLMSQLTAAQCNVDEAPSFVQFEGPLQINCRARPEISGLPLPSEVSNCDQTPHD
jgi:hypothetical protein